MSLMRQQRPPDQGLPTGDCENSGHSCDRGSGGSTVGRTSPSCRSGFCKPPMSAGAARWCNSKLHNKSIYLTKMREVSGLLAPDKEGTTFLRGNGNHLVVKGGVQEISTEKEISV